MKQEKFNALQRGDLIRHVTTGNSFVVVDSNGRGRVTIARTVDAMNPDDWERCPDLDDPRFRNRHDSVGDVVEDVFDKLASTSRSPDPEAGLTMGEPESTPESPVDVRYRANPEVGAIPAEVPADCLGAGVLHIPKRCAEVGEAGHVYKIAPEWYAEADRIGRQYADARTTKTFSVTTTTSGAVPLARSILKTAGVNPTGEQVVSVASALEQLVASSRDVRPTSDIFFEAEQKQVEQREREFTGNTTTSATPDPKSSPFANARPLESFAEFVENFQQHGVEVRPTVVDDGSFARFFPPENEPTIRLGRKALDALRGPFDASVFRPEDSDGRDSWLWCKRLGTWVSVHGFTIVVEAGQ